jgi:hypothetical protein
VEADPCGFLLERVAKRDVLDGDEGTPFTVLSNGEGAVGKRGLDLLYGLLD